MRLRDRTVIVTGASKRNRLPDGSTPRPRRRDAALAARNRESLQQPARHLGEYSGHSLVVATADPTEDEGPRGKGATQAA